jgi:hypothetical protein
MSLTDILTGAASAVGLPVGTHYNLNWRTSGGGIDCSGFVSAIARHFGAAYISATDWTGSLFPKTQPVLSPQIGDLIFFGDPNSVDSHVAIWAGGDQIFQSSTGKGVNFGSLSAMTSYYGGKATYRRIPQLTEALSGETPSTATGTSTATGAVTPRTTGSVSTTDPALASGAQIVSAQSTPAGTTDAPSLFGSTGLGKIVARLSSTGFWWSVGFFVLAGLLIVIGLLVYFHKQVEQVVGDVGRTAAVEATAV